MSEIIVRDLMLPLSEYASISADQTLRQALIALTDSQSGLDDSRHFHRAVLVLDHGGKVIGKLTHWAILKALEPKLLHDEDLEALRRAGLSPSFISGIVGSLPAPGDSLDGLCRVAADMPVREVMVPALESVRESAPIVQAIRTLVLNHAQSMLVTRGGAVVGILRLSDVFVAVADRIR